MIRLDQDDAAYAAKLALPNLPAHYHSTLVNSPYDGSTVAKGLFEILKVLISRRPNPHTCRTQHGSCYSC